MIHRSFWLRPSRMQLIWVYGFQLDNEALICMTIVCTYIVWALQKQWTADCNWIFWRMWCAMRKRKTQGEKAVVEPTHVESKRPDRSLQSLLTLACRIGFAGTTPRWLHSSRQTTALLRRHRINLKDSNFQVQRREGIFINWLAWLYSHQTAQLHDFHRQTPNSSSLPATLRHLRHLIQLIEGRVIER